MGLVQSWSRRSNRSRLVSRLLPDPSKVREPAGAQLRSWEESRVTRSSMLLSQVSLHLHALSSSQRLDLTAPSSDRLFSLASERRLPGSSSQSIVLARSIHATSFWPPSLFLPPAALQALFRQPRRREGQG